MTTVILILVLVAASVLVGLAFAALVSNDGYRRPARPGHLGTPPSSHVPDLFDPASPTRFA